MALIKKFEVKTTVSIRKMPKELWLNVRYQAHKEGLKMNEMIVKIIKFYFENKENDNEQSS